MRQSQRATGHFSHLHQLLSAAARQLAEQRQQNKWVKDALGILPFPSAEDKSCVILTGYNLDSVSTLH